MELLIIGIISIGAICVVISNMAGQLTGKGSCRDCGSCNLVCGANKERAVRGKRK